MVKKSSNRNDSLLIGLSFGIFMPLFLFLLVYSVQYPDLPFSGFVISLWYLDAFFKILALCVLPNVLLFFLYIRKKRDRAARGVLAATLVYAFIMLASKLF